MVLQILIISLIAYLSIIVLKSFYYRYKANLYLKFLTQNINSSKSNKKTKIDFNENKKDSDLKDATILTSATGIYSIYDLYETCDNHDEILTMLANSYSKEIGTNASPFLIHQKLLEISRDPERLKNLMDRRLTGDYGEIKYLVFLKEKMTLRTFVILLFAFIGILIMLKDSLDNIGFLGNIFALFFIVDLTTCGILAAGVFSRGE